MAWLYIWVNMVFPRTSQNESLPGSVQPRTPDPESTQCLCVACSDCSSKPAAKPSLYLTAAAFVIHVPCKIPVWDDSQNKPSLPTKRHSYSPAARSCQTKGCNCEKCACGKTTHLGHDQMALNLNWLKGPIYSCTASATLIGRNAVASRPGKTPLPEQVVA